MVTNTAVGFSDKINDPAIIKELKKTKKITFIFFIIVFLAPIVITFFIGMNNKNMKTVLIGCGISAVILLVNIISVIAQKSKKQWEGTVTAKYTKEQRRNRNTDDAQTVYVVEIMTTEGKKEKISGLINPYYDYFNEGDKVRYYPQFNNYYEKYDKSMDTYVFCPICFAKNDIQNDFCQRCRVPVIK